MKIPALDAGLSHTEGRTERLEAKSFFFATAPNKFLKLGYRENFWRVRGTDKILYLLLHSQTKRQC
jgi:hypothetical protein